jgi:hypothetical protein
MVIVKSKLTGKFLRQHSGSANNFSRKKHYQILRDKEFLADLPEDPFGYNFWIEPASDRQRAISRETHNRMYDAEALEARRFATPGSAISSIGKFVGSRFAPEARKARGIKTKQYALPEHLELHEIVAGNLCLVNADDDEETKRKKKKECA